MGFTILVFAQMLNALCSRSHDQSVFVGLFANKWLWGAIALSALLQVVVIYVPFLNTAFGTDAAVRRRMGRMSWAGDGCARRVRVA